MICFLSKITIECVCSLLSKNNPHDLINSYYASQFSYPKDTLACAQFHSQGPSVCFRNLKTKVDRASFFASLQVFSAWNIKGQTSLSFPSLSFQHYSQEQFHTTNRESMMLIFLHFAQKDLKKQNKHINTGSKSKNSFPKIQTLKTKMSQMCVVQPSGHSTKGTY